MNKLRHVVSKKAEQEFAQETRDSLSKYARYTEMQELYKKVVPPLS